jgi:hypothetical protein
MKIATVATPPRGWFVSLENTVILDIPLQGQVTFLMLFFCNGYGHENIGVLLKSLFSGNSETRYSPHFTIRVTGPLILAHLIALPLPQKRKAIPAVAASA